VRYVIYGAGAIGASIGALLHASGREAILIARGSHLAELQANGLHFETPDRSLTLRLPAFADPARAEIRAGDVVILAMKSQDTEAALDALADVGIDDLSIVCAQNGVENERLALRRFGRVYAMLVLMPSTHLRPGSVQAQCAPVAGLLDLGRYPAGSDDVAAGIAADLTAAGCDSRAVPDAMRWKYAKLLSNIGNALEAACGSAAFRGGLYERAHAEAVACYRAAAIDWVPDVDYSARRAALPSPRPVGGAARDGGSSWQSLARGTGRIEAAYLNGEIVLLGRLHGVATPVNQLLQRVAARMARDHIPPGSMTEAELITELGGAGEAVSSFPAPD
jgi:2-dehydropantoate 2-reductase